MKALIASILLSSGGVVLAGLQADNQFDVLAPFRNGELANYLPSGAVEVFPNSIHFGRKQPNMGGAIWSKAPMLNNDWQVTLKLRISGGEKGGDGMGFWYTREAFAPGPVMGAPDKWTGLGVLIDTYDNDNRNNNPAIMGILNDGTKAYKANQDGEGQYFGGCIRKIRNLETPLALRFSYIKGNFKAELDDSKGGSEYILCFEKKNIDLPAGYYFGISGFNNNYPDSMELMEMKTLSSYSSASNRAQTNNRGGAQEQNRAQTAQQQQQQQQSFQQPPPQQQQYQAPPPPQQQQYQQYQPPPAISDVTMARIDDVLGQKMKALGLDRFSRLEQSFARIEERLNRLSSQITDMTAHVASVDHHGIHEALDNVSADLKDQLEMVRKSAAVYGATNHPQSLSGGGSSLFGSLSTMAIFLVVQVIVLSAFMTIKQKMDDNKKKYL